MLLFRSKENVEEWRLQAQMLPGDLLTVEQVWELSKLWYRDRLSPGFTGRTPEDANLIFDTLGLRPDFWHFEVSH